MMATCVMAMATCVMAMVTCVMAMVTCVMAMVTCVMATIVHVGRKVGPIEKDDGYCYRSARLCCQAVQWAVEQLPPSHCCMFDGIQVNV
jgi:hypothetical protein